MKTMDYFKFRRDECKKASTDKIGNILLSCDQYYIFGFTEVSEKIANYLFSKGKQVLGIISEDAGTTFSNIPLVQLNEADRQFPVVSSALLRVSQSNKLLKRMGFNSVIDFFELNLMDEKLFKFPTIDYNITDIKTSFPKYQWLHGILEDQLSKDILESVLDMRYNNQLSPLLKHSVISQYFDVISDFKNIDTFVDCGGYHGETSTCFINKNQEYNKIYLFEPFPDAMIIAKNELKNQNVKFIQKAVYDKPGILKMTTNREDGNAISLDGDISIETCTMDEVIPEQIDFIKLDIEGSELEALFGAEEIIRKYQPIITVAIYHKQTHFWEIPQYLLTLYPQCKFFLRHNNDGIYETILHIIPKRFYNNLPN